VEHVAARRLGGRRHVLQVLAPMNAPVNSDYHPVVQLEAPRARFLRHSASSLVSVANAPVPVAELLGGVTQVDLRSPGPPVPSRVLEPRVQALQLHEGLTVASEDPSRLADPSVRTAVLALRGRGVLCNQAPSRFIFEQLHWAAEQTLVHLAAPLREALWVEPRWTGCPATRMAAEIQRRFELYAAVARRDRARMLEIAEARLAEPAAEARWQQFALLAGMLGAHADGKTAAANALWSRHSPHLYRSGIFPQEALYLLNWPPQAAGTR
jgi:hypothetical protein